METLFERIERLKREKGEGVIIGLVSSILLRKVRDFERNPVKVPYSLDSFVKDYGSSGFLVSNVSLFDSERHMQTQVVNEADVMEFSEKNVSKLPKYSGDTSCYEIPWGRIDWNACKGKLWVGRTVNNVICIQNENVSKLHGYFVWRNSPWYADAGSSNGTVVNGCRLKPNLPVEVESGYVIELGALSFTYFPAWDFVKKVLKK